MGGREASKLVRSKGTLLEHLMYIDRLHEALHKAVDAQRLSSLGECTFVYLTREECHLSNVLVPERACTGLS